MNRIILAGSGVAAGDVSVRALEAAKNCDFVLVRTALSESGKYITEKIPSAKALDDLYESSRNFDTLSRKLASAVISAAKKGDVTYFVDGDVKDDVSCSIIMKKVKGVEVIPGISRANACLDAAGLSGNVRCVSAYDLTGKRLTLPILVTDVDNRYTAGKVKLILSDAFGDEIPCYKFINGRFKEMMLYEADSGEEFDYSTAIYIGELDFLHRQRFDVTDLADILRALRAENGCPWDRVQTKESIRKNTIEEAYELVDAINRNDDSDICEEVGDVILQALFQICFAEERGAFTLNDAVSEICTKLITRHTHIFGADKAKDAASALEVWDKNKRVEKGFSCGAEYLRSVPNNFPALMRAQKVSSRAAKYNFDFEDVAQVFEKIEEETAEVREAIGLGDPRKIKAECGDLIFSVCNLVRKLGFDSEEALSETTEKFLDRFSALEERILKDGKDMKKLSPKELDDYYNEIKKS